MAMTTKFWTWTEIWTKVSSEMDIADGDFMNEPEAMGHANDAVDEAEAEILEAYPDYFLSRDNLTLVQGEDEYDLPETIYAHKIRRMVYFNGSRIYDVKRFRDWKKFLEYRFARYMTTSTEEYGYFILNSAAGEPKILISPPAYESGQYVEIWFVRQANRFATGSDVCDIPEFVSFVFDFLRERIEWKRSAGSARHVTAKDKLEETRRRMIDTLTTMVPDGENEIEPDMSSYEELS